MRTKVIIITEITTKPNSIQSVVEWCYKVTQECNKDRPFEEKFLKLKYISQKDEQYLKYLSIDTSANWVISEIRQKQKSQDGKRI